MGLGLRRTIDEDGVCRQVLDVEVHGAPNTSSAVNRSCWDDDTLPWLELQCMAAGELDLEKSVHDEKEFI